MPPERENLCKTALATLDSAGVRPPKTLAFSITGDCNLRCAHCWVDAAPCPVPAAGHVAEPVLRRLLEEFALLGGERVCFTGGEPLCHPRWGELLGRARDLGFAGLTLQTNAMLFGAAEARTLRRLDFPGLSVQISLDGGSAAAHNRVRGQGAFQGALAGIRRLAEAGLAGRIVFFFTEMHHNLEELPAVLELAEALGAAAVISGALVRCGRAAAGSPVAPAEPAQYARLLAHYDANPRFRQLYEKLGNTAPLEWRKKNTADAQCCTFIEKPYLTPKGVLYPCFMCHADAFAVAGVFAKGLAAALIEGAPLWASLLQISRRRAAGDFACRNCPELGTCAGGCIGRAWGSGGDLTAADDRCAVRRSVCGQLGPAPLPDR